MQRQTLDEYLRQRELGSADVSPYLANTLGLDWSDAETGQRLRRLDAGALQKQTYTALRQLLLAEAQHCPTVLVLEDLHWIDPASRDFLEYLVETTHGAGLMLVLVSRDTERDTSLRLVLDRVAKKAERFIDIRLGPLSEPEGRQLVEQLLQRIDPEARVIQQRIAARAEGNPFYAEEITRMLIDQGGLVSEADVWQITPLARELVQSVPGTLEGLILARFDRLAKSPRETLRRAAVLGSAFPGSLLRNLSRADPAAVDADLAVLEAGHFLVALVPGPRPSYAFRQALVQETVYKTLLRRDRQRMHEQAARAIEQDGSWLPSEQIEALAHHYALSSAPARAVPYLVIAAENAARRCAHETAIGHFGRALALMRGQPDGNEELLLRSQIGLGQALKLVGEYTKARESLESSVERLLRPRTPADAASLPLLIQCRRELADIRVREGGLVEASEQLEAGLKSLGPDGQQVHPVLWRSLVERLAWALFRQGDLDKAFALASSATVIQDSSTDDDPITIASLYNTLGGVRWQQGSLAEAVAYVEHSLAIYQSIEYLWGMANCYNNLGILYYRLGIWSKALDTWKRTAALREEIGDVQHQAVVLNNLGFLHMSMGSHDQARRDLESGLAIGQRLGDNWTAAQSLTSLAQLAMVQSRFRDASERATAALTLSESVGSREIEVQARWILALARGEDGEPAEAVECASQALDMARQGGFLDLEADCLRALGILYAQAGELWQAETYFQRSRDLCRQQNDPYREALAGLELGQVYVRLAHIAGASPAGWIPMATQALEQASRVFERLGAGYDLRLAREALRESQGQVLQQPDRPAGQWHKAAVLWLTLRPPADADEEAEFEAIAPLASLVTAIAEEHKGQVIRRQGGVTVVFGAPAALEDDGERAVEAASRIVRGLDTLPFRVPDEMGVGVAVSLGSVVAGTIGAPSHSEFVVRGHPVDVAQKLAAATPSGSVWVTEEVRAATERLFLYDPVPDSSAFLPGVAAVWELAGRQKRPAPARGLPGQRPRFVGRESALRAMSGLSANLERGIGGLIWIEGEPGIGKSRLMEEFAALLASGGLHIWSGRASAPKANSAFALWTDALARLLDLQPDDPPDMIQERLDRAVKAWPRDVETTSPYLGLLLGVPPRGPSGERLASLQPEQLRQQLFVSVRRLLKSLSSERPLAVFVDDLHWVDPVSAELLLSAIPLVSSSPVLFVCAQRRQGSDFPNDRLVRMQSLILSQTVSLRLDSLSVPESEMLLDELLPGSELPAAQRAAIVERSEGNPYFIEEYVRMLIERGFLERTENGWVAAPDLDLRAEPLPASLHALIRSRIDTLPPELKEAVQNAAVLGAPFDAGLLAAALGAASAESLLTRLESRLLVCRVPEGDRWQFNHTEIESVVYDSMLTARREALHLAVAKALETRWKGSEAEHAEELAHHFGKAGDSLRALPYLVRAGESAAARFANEEALLHLEKAAEVMSAQPQPACDLSIRIAAALGDTYRAIGRYADSIASLQVGLGPSALEPESVVQRAGLHRRLGETAQKQGEMEAAREYLAQAMALVAELTGRDALKERAAILTVIAWTRFLQGDFERAREACQASMECAHQAGALGELAAAENLLGGIYFCQSQWALALDHTTRALALREQMGDTSGVAATLNNLAILAVPAGQWAKAQSFFERSQALRQELGETEGVAIVHNNLGTLALDQGDLERAEYHLRASLEVGAPFQMSYHTSTSNMALAQVLRARGDLDGAQSSIDCSWSRAEAIGARDLMAEILRVRAEVQLSASSPEQARATAEHAAALAHETGNRSLETAAWRVAADAMLRQGEIALAHRTCAQARAMLAEVTDELEKGRVAAQSGRISLAGGDRPQAEADLHEARDIFARLGACCDLGQVEEELRRLGR